MKVQLTIPLKNRIHKLLLENPELRDNDNALIFKIWTETHPELIKPRCQVWEFFSWFNSNLLTPTESIRRTRQQVQALYPDTRGEKYYKRRKNIPEIINALRELEND